MQWELNSWLGRLGRGRLQTRLGISTRTRLKQSNSKSSFCLILLFSILFSFILAPTGALYVKVCHYWPTKPLWEYYLLYPLYWQYHLLLNLTLLPFEQGGYPKPPGWLSKTNLTELKNVKSSKSLQLSQTNSTELQNVKSSKSLQLSKTNSTEIQNVISVTRGKHRDHFKTTLSNYRLVYTQKYYISCTNLSKVKLNFVKLRVFPNIYTPTFQYIYTDISVISVTFCNSVNLPHLHTLYLSFFVHQRILRPLKIVHQKSE